MSDDQELVTKPFKFVTGTLKKYPSPNYGLIFFPRLTDDHYSRYEPSARTTETRDSVASIGSGHDERRESDLTCIGTDARYPNMNQTKHCWQNYVDYHKCINAKGEDFAPCRQVRTVRELC